jgi:NAD(P)-dependent dehydrogenase (short-subunit alcohol dehydrogenase family)
MTAGARAGATAGPGAGGLDGRVVVITGASAGIGAATAELVARRGGRPVLAARGADALARVASRCGDAALVVVADVTRRADVQQLLERTLAHHGRVDVWINSAGRGITRLVSELTDADLDEMMAVNVKSVLYGMQAVLPHFRERGRGHIINISSVLGRLPTAHFRSAYAAAKHAVNGLTANLRMELRQSAPGIVVSAVHPGIVATEFGRNARHGGPDSRVLPGAQPVEEVAQVIVDLIVAPRADVYTRPGLRELVGAYFSAEDLDAVETRPPYTTGPR